MHIIRKIEINSGAKKMTTEDVRLNQNELSEPNTDK